MGGEVNSAALTEFQGHINRFQVSFYYIPTCSNFHFYLVQPSLTSASTFQCEICISGSVSLSFFSAYVCLCSAVWQEVSGTGC